MDNEDSDGTSAGNTTFISECGVCGLELDKKSENLLTNALNSNSPEGLCGKCLVNLAELHEICLKRSESLRISTSKLISEDIQHSKRLQEVKASALTRIKDFKVVENLNSKLWAVKRDLKDSVAVIQAMKTEKEKSCDELNKKQCLLDEKSKRISDIQNLLRKGEENLTLLDRMNDENQDLLEKLRDFEIDSFLYTRELFEAVQFTRNQFAKEKSAKGVLTLSPGCDIENLKSIQNSLQEEILNTRKRIDALSELLSSSLTPNSDL
jgi:hypothetical protein